MKVAMKAKSAQLQKGQETSNTFWDKYFLR